MQRIQEGKFIMKKAISVLMVAACMLCMVTACEKKDKKENDTSAAQATETDCTAAELVTTEPEGEITISEMIDQRIKEEGKITLYTMLIGLSETPLEITEDLNVNIISYDGKELIDYGNSSNRRGETRLGDIIHNKVDYSTYNIGAYGGKWKRYDNEFGDEKYVEEVEKCNEIKDVKKRGEALLKAEADFNLWMDIYPESELFIAGMLEVRYGTRQRKRTV